MPDRRHERLLAGLLLAAALGGLASIRSSSDEGAASRTEPESAQSQPPSHAGSEPRHGPSLIVPSGGPPRLSCGTANAVVQHARAELAVAPAAPDPAELAELWIGWFDPHGLWSAAPDAPLAELFRARALTLIGELGSPFRPADCSAALEIGASARRWISELRVVFEEQRVAAGPMPPDAAFELAAGPVFEDDPVSRPARELAADLGWRLGTLSASFPELASLAETALERFLPELSTEQWAEVALAAFVRAYVPTVDPHGQWAPADEETSLYLDDPALDPGAPLWGRMLRTGFGVRITEDPAPPLLLDDLVLSIDGAETPGLSVEQLEQLARVATAEGRTISRVTLLRAGVERALTLDVPLDPEPSGTEEHELERVAYGTGEVLVVRIPEIGDDAGDELAAVLSRSRGSAAGLLLDLRGNGGGSTQGALDVLASFLPDAPVFPLLYRGALREVLRTGPAPDGVLWQGPLGVLVDGYTASAAEMIAGALQAYGRALVVGSRTFGKGCIQEYFDHDFGGGVLRLTTLSFALPDGSPVQRVGLEPQIALGLPRAEEREADLLHALPAMAALDVREHGLVLAESRRRPGWPRHGGRVGPCADHVVCDALAALGAADSGARRAPKNRATPRARVRYAD